MQNPYLMNCSSNKDGIKFKVQFKGIANALMMVVGVTETSARCRVHLFLQRLFLLTILTLILPIFRIISDTDPTI